MIKKEEIEEIKQEMKNLYLEDLAEIIRKEPLIEGKQEICIYKKEQKKELKEKLHEIACLVLELSQLEQEFIEENLKIFKNTRMKNKRKTKVKDITIEGDYDEAMEQLENADIPEEVKALARREIRRHFKVSL